jgi:hypothetical protein
MLKLIEIGQTVLLCILPLIPVPIALRLYLPVLHSQPKRIKISTCYEGRVRLGHFQVIKVEPVGCVAVVVHINIHIARGGYVYRPDGEFLFGKVGYARYRRGRHGQRGGRGIEVAIKHNKVQVACGYGIVRAACPARKAARGVGIH